MALRRKTIVVSKSLRKDYKDLVISEEVLGRKYLVFISVATAKKIMGISEDLVMKRKGMGHLWTFAEDGRVVSVEIGSNRGGSFLMIQTETRNEKRWRRRVFFIPEGSHGEGWISLARKIRGSLNMQNVSQVDHQYEKSSESLLQNAGWTKIQAQTVKSNKFGDWEYMVVCKVDRYVVDWQKVGHRVARVFEAELDFEIFPFNDNHALVLAYTEEDRDLLCNKNEFFGEDEGISLFPWKPSINNMIFSSEPNGGWLGIYGLPFHLWNLDMFTTIANLFGGLALLDENTICFNDLSVARMKVNGDLGKVPNRLMIEDDGIEFPIEIRIISEPVGNKQGSVHIIVPVANDLANQRQEEEGTGLLALNQGGIGSGLGSVPMDSGPTTVLLQNSQFVLNEAGEFSNSNLNFGVADNDINAVTLPREFRQRLANFQKKI